MVPDVFAIYCVTCVHLGGPEAQVRKIGSQFYCDLLRKMCVYIYVYVSICMCIHIYIYTHAYTRMFPPPPPWPCGLVDSSSSLALRPRRFVFPPRCPSPGASAQGLAPIGARWRGFVFPAVRAALAEPAGRRGPAALLAPSGQIRGGRGSCSLREANTFRTYGSEWAHHKFEPVARRIRRCRSKVLRPVGPTVGASLSCHLDFLPRER